MLSIYIWMAKNQMHVVFLFFAHLTPHIGIKVRSRLIAITSSDLAITLSPQVIIFSYSGNICTFKLSVFVSLYITLQCHITLVHR